MEAAKKRNIRSGTEYDHLFPAASVDTHTIMRHAEVSDTVGFIPDVVSKTLDHTKKIAAKLKGYNDYDTCRNIWHFVYNHIAYKKDKDGYEQVRSPARSWHDRRDGVDCDCYATFISSILSNLKIPHLLRITKYNRDYFQHIYPVARLPGKTEVIIDCVTDKFNYEVPYSEKKDFIMDLQYLDGIDMEGLEADFLQQSSLSPLSSVSGENESMDYVDDMHGWDDRGDREDRGDGLGRAHKKKKKATHEAFEDFIDHGDSVPAYGVKKKKGFKKLLNFVNKVNPATVTLRNGVLAAMKLNIAQLPKRLRWSYLTPNEARKKGIDIERWKQLVSVRQKLDNIFFGAGGKPENLKKAIMKGKGNKDKALHGLEAFHPHVYDHNSYDAMSVHTPLHQLLGADIFDSENERIEGFGELGEPLTMTAVAAASGVIASLVKMLKKVGDIFKGKGAHSSDFNSKETQDAEKDIPGTDPSSQKSGDSSGDNNEDNTTKLQNKNSGTPDSGGDGDSPTDPKDKRMALTKTNATDLSVDNQDTDTGKSDSSTPPGADTFWSKNKKWLLPASIGVGGIALVAAGIAAMKGHGKHKPVHGIPNNPIHPIHPIHHGKKKNHHRKKKGKPKNVDKVQW
ncbi:MAG: hypothetical protein ACHQD8_01380 [Chitinophagales bacterium]